MPSTPSSARQLAQARWALLYGNFAIGCGVMVAAGAMNDLLRDLHISLAQGGQLISWPAVVIAVCAPLLAALVSGADRRRLLTWSLLWFGLGHAVSALVTDFDQLLPLRTLAVLGAAVFTPQAAAAIGVMAPPEQRGRAITFIFLGWSLSSVLGMPINAWLSDTQGWRAAFGLVALLSVLGAAWVWRAMPDGVRPAALSRASWAQVFTHPALLAILLVTALSSAGQFTLFGYLAPYYRQALSADALQISMLFLWFGAVSVLGNVLMVQRIDRVGASRAVLVALAAMAMSLLLWPLAGTVATMALVLVPWALGCFAANSAQQARLSLAAPALTPALIALNTSGMYLGQALGAASGGAVEVRFGFAQVHWAGLAWLLLAMVVSVWGAGRLLRQPVGPGHV